MSEQCKPCKSNAGGKTGLLFAAFLTRFFKRVRVRAASWTFEKVCC